MGTQKKSEHHVLWERKSDQESKKERKNHGGREGEKKGNRDGGRNSNILNSELGALDFDPQVKNHTSSPTSTTCSYDRDQLLADHTLQLQ